MILAMLAISHLSLQRSSIPEATVDNYHKVMITQNQSLFSFTHLHFDVIQLLVEGHNLCLDMLQHLLELLHAVLDAGDHLPPLLRLLLLVLLQQHSQLPEPEVVGQGEHVLGPGDGAQHETAVPVRER